MVRRRPSPVVLVAVALALLGGAALAVFALWPRGGHGGAQAQAVPCVRPAARVSLSRPPGAGWLAGDAALSIAVPGRGAVWLFGDSFFRAGDGDVHLVRNALVLDGPAGLQTLGPDSGHVSFFRPTGDRTEDVRWFWPSHGIANENHLWVLLSEMRQAGETGRVADFDYVYSWLADVQPSTWAIRWLRPVGAPREIIWGAWVLPLGRRVYVFGIEDRPAAKRVFLARTQGETLASRWELWDGRRFARRVTPRPVASDVGAQISVVPVKGGFALLTQVGVSPEIRLEVLRARSLTGPWGRRETIYAGAAPEGRITYNLSAHPEYGHASLLVSVSSAVADPDRWLEGAEPMRPLFFWVRRSCLALSPASRTASAPR